MRTSEAANQKSLRRRNLGTVLRHVHRAGRISRARLTTVTHLNRSTVGTLVADLAARGLVEEGEAVGRGTPGRPSPLVQPRPDGPIVVAVDIAVATLSFAVAGIGGGLDHHVRMDRPPDRRTPEATVADLVELTRRVLDELPGDRRVLGVGVAVAGMVRMHDGFVHVAPNLGWHDLPLGQMLTEGLGGSIPVAVGNDADLGALAENTRGAGVGVDDMIYVASEVGVGGGIIVEGRPLSGAAGYAGEIGHIVVNPDGVECRCGARGCLESETGEWALLRMLGRSSTNEREAVDAVLAEAADGDPDARAALATIGTSLGIGLSGLANVFNPNRIVLGGFFGRAYPYLADAVAAELDVHTQAPSRAMVNVVPAQLGEDSSLIGAVELALAPVLADPTLVPSPLAQEQTG